MSSQTQQQDNREKVRLVLETANIPASELEDFISEDNGFWMKAQDGDLWHIPVKILSNDKVCPTLIFNIREAVSQIDDRKNKKISFSLSYNNQTYICGINEFNRDGKPIEEDKLTVWRVKQKQGGGSSSFQGGGGNKGFAPQPLAELFIGTIEQCNIKLMDESKKWYLADQKIFMTNEEGETVAAFAILKRNRYVPPPPTTSQ